MGDKWISEWTGNRCLFLQDMCVWGGSKKIVVIYFWDHYFLQGFWLYTQLICSLLSHPNYYLFICFCWLHAIPHPSPLESHWPHVNYFVNPHISFNCCEFVYPGDQIELGEIEGGCQHRSAGKTDECISNSLTMEATVRHTDGITDFNGCMDGVIPFMHRI